jgi:hypothetical protein
MFKMKLMKYFKLLSKEVKINQGKNDFIINFLYN